jgi:surfactin synthase thioesterase subunit
MNLYCFPFAGGNKYSYNNFLPCLKPGLTMVPVELPGRGARSKEPLLVDVREMAYDLFLKIRAELSRPYAFYGHSMGSVLAYLVARHALEAGLCGPNHLFLSGRGGLCTMPGGKIMHTLPTDAFVEEIRHLGGTPEKLLDDKDLIHFMVPVLKADFQAVESYREEIIKPLDVPVTVMTGNQDLSHGTQQAGWQKISTRLIESIVFDGGHFFIQQHAKEIMDIIDVRLR